LLGCVLNDTSCIRRIITKLESDMKFQHWLSLHGNELENKKKYHGTIRNKNAPKETTETRNEIVSWRKGLKDVDKA
jgi:hypothetical protein